jgi:Cu(I)/Ag(I) efflux system membrane protein CusA/SilA
MIGGMVSSTILTLLVIPVIYALWRGKELQRLRSAN